jgi:hypothetical protein
MSTLPDGPQKFFTSQEIDAWLRSAKEKRAQLHLKAAGPWHNDQIHEAFVDMSELLQEAFEEVRVISASLREGSHVVRSESADLQAHSARLMEQSTTLIERMSQFVAPSSEKVQEAESRLLDMFKGNRKSSE